MLKIDICYKHISRINLRHGVPEGCDRSEEDILSQVNLQL